MKAIRLPGGIDNGYADVAFVRSVSAVFSNYSGKHVEHVSISPEQVTKSLSFPICNLRGQKLRGHNERAAL